jgi:DNA-binding response OmpR family regulator
MTVKNSKILIIEDDKFLAKMLSKTLAASGFEVILASGGNEALKKLTETEISLILLDIMLPDIDGFDLLQKVRIEGKNKNTPVIIMSNLGQPEDIARGKKMGAVDYLVKSDLSLDQVLAKVRSCLKLK